MRNFSCLLFMILGLTTAALAAEDFHPAKSAAEVALVHTLEKADNDNNFTDFLLGTPRYDSKKDDGYLRLVTKALQASIATTERNEVKSECDGKYVDGQICGIDWLPLTCAQDTPDNGYDVHTIKAGGDEAIIIQQWHTKYSTQRSPITYRLIKQDGNWKIDGVNCGDQFNTRFNMR